VSWPIGVRLVFGAESARLNGQRALRLQTQRLGQGLDQAGPVRVGPLQMRPQRRLGTLDAIGHLTQPKTHTCTAGAKDPPAPPRFGSDAVDR
jgi:hypothetical protein